MKVVLISDTHNQHLRLSELPSADIIIHAGDATGLGKRKEFIEFISWYGSLTYSHKIFIAGNHDWCLDPNYLGDLKKEEAELLCREAGIIYLLDQAIEIQSKVFYGTPWQPYFFNWAFNIKSEEERAKIYSQIPINTDFLITHTPPAKILDSNKYGLSCGCEALLSVVQKVKPQFHVFGHIHEAYGKKVIADTTFINAANLDESYRMKNPPFLIEI